MAKGKAVADALNKGNVGAMESIMTGAKGNKGKKAAVPMKAGRIGRPPSPAAKTVLGG